MGFIKFTKTDTCESIQGLGKIMAGGNINGPSPVVLTLDQKGILLVKLLTNTEARRLTCVGATGFHQQDLGTAQGPPRPSLSRHQ